MDTKLYIRHYVNYNYKNKGIDEELVNRIEKLYLNELDHLKHLKKNQKIIDNMTFNGFFKYRKQELKNIVNSINSEQDFAVKAIDIVNENLNDFLKSH